MDTASVTPGILQVWNNFTEADKNDQVLDRTLRYLVMCDYTPLSLAAGNLLVRYFRWD